MKINTISGYVLVYLLSYGHWNIVVPVRAEGGGTGAGTKTGVDLNIKSDTKSKDKFGYEKVGEYVTYTAKGDNAFKLVKEDKTDVWKATDANSYSTRVEVEFLANDGRAVTIYLADNKTKVFKRDSKDTPWNEIDTSKINPVSINIAFKSNSFKYTNTLQGDTRTFEARDGFAFNHVRHKSGNDSFDIWKTDNENEYSKKVELEGDNKLTIHIGEGDSAPTKVFNKGGYCEWKEDTQASTQKSTTDGSGGTDQSGGGKTGNDGSGGTDQSGGGATQTSPTSGGGTTGTDGSGGSTETGGGGTQQSTPATQ